MRAMYAWYGVLTPTPGFVITSTIVRKGREAVVGTRQSRYQVGGLKGLVYYLLMDPDKNQAIGSLINCTLGEMSLNTEAYKTTVLTNTVLGKIAYNTTQYCGAEPKKKHLLYFRVKRAVKKGYELLDKCRYGGGCRV